ncbi:MAG: zinc ABC transporter substrate-binding protein [Rhizobiaceae bacterium]
MRAAKSFLIASTILAVSTIAARADVQVVASIKPVHSLVAAVMKGVGEPGLIVEGAASPHSFSLRPSQAAMLEEADVVFWIGHELEAFLEKPLEALAGDSKAVELIDAHDLTKLGLREGGTFDAHDHSEHEAHEDHDHADHDDHAHDKDDDHAHDKHDEQAEEHDDHDHAKADDNHAHDEHDGHDKAEAEHHDDHGHGEFNVHVWVDPVNAKALVHEIEETLSGADPDNAAKYMANAADVMARLDSLTANIKADLETVKGKPFVVFHDAYQNFEDRFGLTAVGSITVSPEVQPGAERVAELRAKISELGATCVFSEPQFEPKIVQTITEGTSAKSGVIDPLGASLQDGPDLYFELIRNMATSFKTCLSEAS